MGQTLKIVIGAAVAVLLMGGTAWFCFRYDPFRPGRMKSERIRAALLFGIAILGVVLSVGDRIQKSHRKELKKSHMAQGTNSFEGKTGHNSDIGSGLLAP